MTNSILLARDTNQALGLGQFAIDFLKGTLGSGPSELVKDRTLLFHTDAVLCGFSAIALETNSPIVLRNEALEYTQGNPEKAAFVFGSNQGVMPEKAILANSAAVREWDSNGTNFGFRPELGHTAGEFGHNDFYPVAVAACQQRGLSGKDALMAMILIDEIRGRLAEVFSLKTYKIDHVVHGAIASAAAYGAIMGATAEQIEHAIGMVVAHYIPWRAIRAGKQLSDSKGASAAISTEAAIISVKRAMNGFIGPKDIFRNPEAMFRYFEPTTTGAERWKESGDSPFDLQLSHSGDDFAVMGMHFKLGLYEHQSAGAIQGVIDLIRANPDLLQDNGNSIEDILIRVYEPAFGIIGNPMKRTPSTRQSADHSMVYIICTLLKKAILAKEKIAGMSNDEVWKLLILTPYDYNADSISDPLTRSLINKVRFEHGGKEYDDKYPDGIPTSVNINSGLDSGLIMYPVGHSRNKTADLKNILRNKWRVLGALAFPDGTNVEAHIDTFQNLASLSSYELASIFDIEIASRPGFE